MPGVMWGAGPISRVCNECRVAQGDGMLGHCSGRKHNPVDSCTNRTCVARRGRRSCRAGFPRYRRREPCYALAAPRIMTSPACWWAPPSALLATAAAGAARSRRRTGRSQHRAGGDHTPAELRRESLITWRPAPRRNPACRCGCVAAVPGGAAVQPAGVGRVPSPGASARPRRTGRCCRRRGGELLPRPLLVVPAGAARPAVATDAPAPPGRPAPAGDRGIVWGRRRPRSCWL